MQTEQGPVFSARKQGLVLCPRSLIARTGPFLTLVDELQRAHRKHYMPFNGVLNSVQGEKVCLQGGR